jgi:hypothetical protein
MRFSVSCWRTGAADVDRSVDAIVAAFGGAPAAGEARARSKLAR